MVAFQWLHNLHASLNLGFQLDFQQPEMTGKNITQVTALILFTILVMEGYFLYTGWNREHDGLKRRMQAKVLSIAAFCSPLLEKDSKPILENALYSYLGDEEILGVFVSRKEPNGGFHEYAKVSKEDHVVELQAGLGETLIADAPIHFNGRLLGQIQLFAAVDQLNARTRHLLLSSLLRLSLAISLGVAFYMHVLDQQRSARDLRSAKGKLEAVLKSTRATEEKFRNIYENADEGIYQVLTTGQFLTANPAMAKIAGYHGPDDLIEKVTDVNEQFYMDKERRAECILAMEKESAVSNFESRVRRSDGSIIWVSENVRAVRDLENNLLYYEGFVTDITQRKAAQQEAEQAFQKAISANAAKDKFIAVLSHELRTPLTAIIGYCEILQDDLDEHTAKESLSDLQNIKTASEHLLALIGDLLDLSKVESGRHDFQIEDFEVAKFLEDVTATFEPEARKTGNKLEVNCASNLGKMHSEPTRLRQILFNIINNGLKFTENGHITLNAYRQFRKGEDWVVFSVQDDGQGMDEEQIRRLSEELTTPDLWTTRQDGSAGMGLTISNRICHAMSGTISVSSVQGKGSNFEVSLPANAKEA